MFVSPNSAFMFFQKLLFSQVLFLTARIAVLKRPLLRENFLKKKMKFCLPRPGQPRPAQASIGQHRPAQASPGQPRPGQPRPAQASPGQPRPAQASPGQPRPAQASPGQHRPAQASTGHKKTCNNFA